MLGEMEMMLGFNVDGEVLKLYWILWFVVGCVNSFFMLEILFYILF